MPFRTMKRLQAQRIAPRLRGMVKQDEPQMVAFVRDRLCNSRQSMQSIADATGLSKRWLEFMRIPGRIPRPSLQNLELVVRHFGHRVEIVPERRKGSRAG